MIVDYRNNKVINENEFVSLNMGRFLTCVEGLKFFSKKKKPKKLDML